MKFISIRLIARDLERLVGFYEQVTGIAPVWYTEDFAELRTPGGTLALGSERTMSLFAPGAAEGASNRSVIIELLVNDVDQTFERVAPQLEDVLQKPTTMPWGNRSLLFRDPEGNLINFFSPVTEAAKQKFARDL
jgi:predicted enzyme related to lactoylglutathione lyase